METPTPDKDNLSTTSCSSLRDTHSSETSRAIKQGTYFPASTPTRPIYLAVRFVSATLCVILVVLAVVASRVANRPEWMPPILSPALSVFFASAIDILVVKVKDRRYPRLQRLLHDGAIAVGCTVAGGFLIAFTLDDIRGTREGACAGTMGLAWLILLCMFAVVILHLGISVAAAVEMFRVRRRQTSGAV